MSVNAAGQWVKDIPCPPDGRGRSRRVTVLLVGILVLSIADLVITLTHLTTIGMMEANPIAAALIRATDSSWLLGIFKTITVGVSLSVLFCLRRHIQAEIAAWLGVLILSGVALMWHSYTEEVIGSPDLVLAQGQVDRDSWLMLD
jgi:hypothetical protein